MPLRKVEIRGDRAWQHEHSTQEGVQVGDIVDVDLVTPLLHPFEKGGHVFSVPTDGKAVNPPRFEHLQDFPGLFRGSTNQGSKEVYGCLDDSTGKPFGNPSESFRMQVLDVSVEPESVR